MYMLNDVLLNPGVFTNRYSVCVRPSCVLDNDCIVSECNSGTVVWLTGSYGDC